MTNDTMLGGYLKKPPPELPLSDMVQEPPHYLAGGIETIDFIEAKLPREQFIGFCMGNAIKYLARANFKEHYKQDINKANVYMRWAVRLINGETWGEIRESERNANTARNNSS